MAKRLLFVELNEFNHRLLIEASEIFNLSNIKRALSLPHQAKTVTEDLYDSGYLEPWVQWVSVHTGRPSSDHKIKHLGDTNFSQGTQIWEKLSEKGISSGIWGAMNATRGSADKCKFFLPDPWTFEEQAYPSEINSFLKLPRYMARNYLKPRFDKLFGAVIQFATFLCTPKAIWTSLCELPTLLPYVIRYRAANFVTYSFAEYLSSIRFFDYWERERPQFSSLFLNLVAHSQHYYWEDKPLEKNDRLRYTFRYLDKILGELFNRVGPDTDILIANGLTQMNTNKEPAWILYRQNDHVACLQRFGLTNVKVEACMTHDAHLFFEDKAAKDRAFEVLQSAKVGDKRLFHVEEYANEPLRLFYMIEFTDPVDATTTVSWSGGNFKMLEEFTPIVRRTAKHVNAGIAIATADILPSKPFPNHEIYNAILKYFDLAPQTAM